MIPPEREIPLIERGDPVRLSKADEAWAAVVAGFDANDRQRIDTAIKATLEELSAGVDFPGLDMVSKPVVTRFVNTLANRWLDAKARL